MKKKTYSFEGETLTVHYQSKRCIHAAECVNGLPAVFDPDKRPWIQVDNADAASVIEVVGACPTGALQCEGPAADEDDSELGPNIVSIVEGGPVYVSGNVRIVDSDGELVLHDTRVALCRCGQSRNRPFCDNSHVSGFSDAGTLGKGGVRFDDGASPEEVLEIRLATNGPVLLSGSFVVRDARGEESRNANKSALCRCGDSANKPFCDGSHKSNGFTTG